MQFNYYEILGVAKSASQNEIKSAYKKLAVKYHPDKNQGNAFAEEHFKKVNQAYQTLSHPDKKIIYDSKLMYGFTSRTTGANNNSGKTYTQKTYTQKTAGKKRPMRPKPVQKNFQWKYFFYALTFFIVFGTGSVIFYGFMNRYAAQKYYQEGMVFLKEQNHISAYEKFSEAIELDSDNPRPYVERARLGNDYFGDYQTSIYDYNKSIYLLADSMPELYLERANSYIALWKYEPALVDLKKYIDLRPDDQEGHFIKAEIESYRYLDFQNAIKSYSEVLKLNNLHKEALFGRGYSYLQALDYDASLKDFKKVKDIDSFKKKEIEYYMAFAYLGKKDTSMACNYWQSAYNHGMKDAENVLKKLCK